MVLRASAESGRLIVALDSTVCDIFGPGRAVPVPNLMSLEWIQVPAGLIRLVTPYFRFGHLDWLEQIHESRNLSCEFLLACLAGIWTKGCH